MKFIKQVIGLLSSAVIAVTGFSVNATQSNISFTVNAVDFNYPVQEFRMGIGDTNRNVNVSGTTLSSQTDNGTKNEKWYLNYVSSGVYEIVSSESSNILTSNNGSVVLAKDADAANQRWNIVPVEKDFEGFDLYYKIVSNADNSTALTFKQDSNGFSLEKYTGENYQKYRLNLDGLEGYAANASIEGKMKAGTIGGLLGETVFVNNVSDFISALDSTEPKTVVVTGNLDLVNQSKEKQRIRDNKTIVGSYSDNTVYDSQLRNDDFWGNDDAPSNNIVIRNMNFVARTLNSSNSGVILLQFYGVRNLWVDHCNFSATFGQNKDQEVGKFIWINTPAANWSDGKYNAVNPDYITISYNYLKNRFWTFAFGSQNTDTSRLRATVMFNKWEECSRRCPQYGNSSAHNYSNYHTVSNGKNANQSSQVICGEGSRVLNENCRFEAMTGNEVDFDKNLCISFKEQGSYTSESVGGTPQALNAGSKGTALNPKDNYGYSLIEAYNTKGTDVKSFCNAYSGCFSSQDKIKYITDADMSGYVSAKYSSPFLKEISVGNSTAEKVGTEMDTSACYMIKNVNSGQYMEVQNGKAQNGANVQQWGANGAFAHNVWHLKEINWGYYYIYSALGDGESLLLSVNSGSNGENIEINSKNGYSTQYFKFVDNGDGTYTIVTRASKDASCVEIADASTNSGANVQQWTCNDNDCQKWIMEKVDYILPSQQTVTTEITDVTITSTTSVTTSEVSELMYGDINQDGEITIADAVMLKKYLLASYSFTKEQWEAAKLTADDEVNCFDFVILKRILIKNLATDNQS